MPSLGAVLYEMLAGAPPHTGPTAQAIIAQVIADRPRRLSQVRETVPPHVEAAVAKALQKVPADRFSSAARLAEALGRPGLVELPDEAPPAATSARGLRRRWIGAAPWALFVAAAALGAWGWLRTRPAETAPVARFGVTLPGNGIRNVLGSTIAVSPDGARIAYVGFNEHLESQLYLRGLDQLDPIQVPAARGTQPFFSPDGQWLGFFAQGKVMKVALTGGPPLTICSADSGFYGASWGRGDIIVFSTGRGLMRVPAAGGQSVALTAIDSNETAHAWPDFLPDGKTVLFTVRDEHGDRLAAVTLTTRVVTRFAQAGTNPHYVTTGHVVLANLDGTLNVVPFDVAGLALGGPSVTLAEGVAVQGEGAALLGVSRSGSLAYKPAGGNAVIRVDRHGAVQPLTSELRGYASPRLSPDGRRVAVRLGRAASSGIWVGAGSPTPPTSPRAMRFTSGRSPVQARSGRSRSTAGPRRGGHRTVGSCSIAPATG